MFDARSPTTSLGLEVAGVCCPSKGEEWNVPCLWSGVGDRSLWMLLQLLSGEVGGLALHQLLALEQQEREELRAW